MLLRTLETFALLVCVALAAISITLIKPADLPITEPLQPVRLAKAVCPAGTPHVGPSEHVGAIDASGKQLATAQVLPASEQPTLLSGDQLLVGGSLLAAGDSLTEWLPCTPALASGALVLPSPAATELVLTNSDKVAASVDLTLLTKDGEVSPVGARDILVGVGQQRRIGLNALVSGEDPVAVLYTARTGRVSLHAITKSGQTLAGLSAASPSQQLYLPGVDAGAKTVRVLLANPDNERAAVTITALGSTPRYIPNGGADISIPARSSLAIELSGALNEDASTLIVDADRDIIADLVVAADGSDQARIAPATSYRDLAAVVPAKARVLLGNPGEADVSVRLSHTPLGGQEEISRLVIPAGKTSQFELPGDQPTFVVAETTGKIVGAVALAGPGVAVAPMQPYGDPETSAVPARLDLSLR
ncbi:MAG: hypothetical protein CSA64_00645 [Arachnia propionica]|nr:MAG: hypothetical protein CSA64_00645 [Arachnia propionica]